MTATPPSPPSPPYASYPPPLPPDHRPGARSVPWWRRAAAGVGIGALLGVGVGVPVALGVEHLRAGTSATAHAGVSRSAPIEGMPDPGGTVGEVPAVQQQQQSATDAESTGLVLVDTTLTSGAGAGTGTVLDSDGTVLTNYHVVEGATSVQVTVAATGETYDAEVVGHDESADVALLQLDGASGLDTVTVDDDGDGAVGDSVTVVGNSEGQGSLLASSGDVLATDEDITTSDQLTGTDHDLSGLLETDAYAVSGDSGGAMLDDEGEVVGITTAVSSGQTVHSYAVPIDDALEVVQQIESGAETSSVQIGPSAYLGLAVSQQGARGGSDGLTLTGVEDGGPAADAGLAAGDVLTSVDGTDVHSLADVQDVLAGHDPGDSVTITWTSNGGGQQSDDVTLGESPTA